MDSIQKIRHNEIVEITNPFPITWHNGKSRLCGDFGGVNNYKKADRYPIPRIPHALDKIVKAKYITKMYCMKETWEDHAQYINRVLRKCTPINLGISLKKCNFCQQELLALGHKVSGLSLAIDQQKVAAVLQKPLTKKIKELQSFLVFASYYRNLTKRSAHITSSLYKLCSKEVVFEITKERREAYERIKHELKNAPLLFLTEFELPFKLYIDAACGQGLGEGLHERQIVDGEPREGLICYISRKLEDSEASYGAT
ncbi:hypothetical protein O181_016461 [Austropuccinia psidii MF-1]|uniref:Reverse transcriptase/retrotransposon-derived protein RNase H-like domain-containing protein n=1 Tax=Austropuccinia psidii MF-1 TaxID=1389203 RepID=A0A9Q3C1R2_9BASI|nr:hypothetical protein [Austropuccinia psidii MF-1]